MKRALGCLLATLYVAACAPAYKAPPVSVLNSASSHAALERGHRLHEAKCAKCHAFEDPANYTAVEWRDDIMPVMGPKSKLTAAESSDVLAYLLAAREVKTPRAPASGRTE